MSIPNPKDIYSLMGFAVSYMQTVERTLRFVTTFVVQDGGELTLSGLQSLDKKERKKALGYFIAKVRDRADLFPDLGGLLTNYLNSRNDFIHNHDAIPGWDLTSEDGVAVARTFTLTLIRQAHKINEVFIALTMRWQAQTGIYPPDQAEGQEFFDEIDKKYGYLVDVFFTAKKTNQNKT
jgi:hypothetical protein